MRRTGRRALEALSLRKEERDWGAWLVAAMLVALAVYGAWQVFRWGGRANQAAIGDACFWPVNLAAVVLAWRVAASRDADRHVRRAWSLIGWGLLLYLFGDVVQFLDEVVLHSKPYPSWADVCYLAFYPLMLAGILQLPHARVTRHDLLRLATDAGVVMLGAGAVVWYVLLGPTALSGGESTLQLAFSVAYPVGDLVLIFGATTLAFRGVTGISRRPLGVFCAGLGFFVAADLVYGHLALENAYQGGDPVDTLWMVALALIVLSAHLRYRDVRRPRPVDTAEGVRRLSFLAYVAVAVSFALLMAALASSDGFTIGTGVLATAITALVLLRLQRLFLENQRQGRYFRALVENVSDNILVLDASGAPAYISPSMERLLGCGSGTLRAESFDWTLVVPEERRHGLERVLGELNAHPGSAVSIELQARAAHGELRTMVGHASNLLDDAAVRGTVFVFHDITERVALEAQLRHQALHDTLTGLPNRALIYDRMTRVLAAARRRGSPVAVLFIDLDNFKDVNDSLGHGAGDALLQAVASRLDDAVRGEDTVGRLGGDEFIVVAELALGETADLLAQRILDVLADPFTLEDHPGHSLSVRASIGIATTATALPDDLLRDADAALYRAKALGKNRVVAFEPEMHRLAEQRHELEVELHQALPRGELFLVYQPVVDLEQQRLLGMEALLRWARPGHGVLAPDEFLPLLEETGLIESVGRWVLREACARAVDWRPDGDALSIGVNVSAGQLASEAVVGDVAGALESSGLDPSRLVLEIKESALLRDPTDTAARLRQLKALGLRIAIDDFGTGYSSLSYLRQFPIDVLKIDGTFVAQIGASREAATLVRMLVGLGRELGLETVAEGVEDESQAAALQSEECDSGQGFWFARPMPCEDVPKFLADWPAARLAVPGAVPLEQATVEILNGSPPGPPA